MEKQIHSILEQLDGLLPLILEYASQFFLALIVLFVGWKLVNAVTRAMGRMMEASHIEPTLRGFLLSVVGLFLKALLLISVASMVGIATTSFVAVLGAAGLAVGMALQGSLANFAGGVLILLFRPLQGRGFNYGRWQFRNGYINRDVPYRAAGCQSRDYLCSKRDIIKQYRGQPFRVRPACGRSQPAD